MVHTSAARHMKKPALPEVNKPFTKVISHQSSCFDMQNNFLKVQISSAAHKPWNSLSTSYQRHFTRKKTLRWALPEADQLQVEIHRTRLPAGPSPAAAPFFRERYHTRTVSLLL
ncbi:hypothetical protein TNCV_306981 [Trichonephila clavipes]|nr:hypothetical protein TNCV_306981 [Trichonephila clavipes]